jgi:predicted dithiol-disulfide oxidoreductase (DUF899 family)
MVGCPKGAVSSRKTTYSPARRPERKTAAVAMVKVEKEFFSEGPRGIVPLLELFAGYRQLTIYQFHV